MTKVEIKNEPEGNYFLFDQEVNKMRWLVRVYFDGDRGEETTLCFYSKEKQDARILAKEMAIEFKTRCEIIDMEGPEYPEWCYYSVN